MFYSLALTFGTLLSSQGTEASFETVSPVPPGFPFVFPSLPDPLSRFRPPLGGFAGPALSGRSDDSETLSPIRSASLFG
ncbi:hypothetical protein C0036_15350 [Streptomyces sp. DJ]|nr:hypothetical protein C0036_15350 [Streptomyces sp. DJ]